MKKKNLKYVGYDIRQGPRQTKRFRIYVNRRRWDFVALANWVYLVKGIDVFPMTDRILTKIAVTESEYQLYCRFNEALTADRMSSDTPWLGRYRRAVLSDEYEGKFYLKCKTCGDDHINRELEFTMNGEGIRVKISNCCDNCLTTSFETIVFDA